MGGRQINMANNRRSFLKKLGIGSFVMSAGGIFTLEKPALIIADNEQPKKGMWPPEKELDLKYVEKEDLMKLCSNIFDALDGKATDPRIYEAVRATLTRNSVYEHADYHKIEVTSEVEIKHG